jgi:hypothetical protein
MVWINGILCTIENIVENNFYCGNSHDTPKWVWNNNSKIETRAQRQDNFFKDFVVHVANPYNLNHACVCVCFFSQFSNVSWLVITEIIPNKINIKIIASKLRYKSTNMLWKFFIFLVGNLVIFPPPKKGNIQPIFKKFTFVQNSTSTKNNNWQRFEPLLVWQSRNLQKVTLSSPCLWASFHPSNPSFRSIHKVMKFY